MAFRTYAASFALLASVSMQLSAQETTAGGSVKDENIVVEGEKEDPSLDKVICKTIKTTGSRLSQDRECKTKRQWEAGKAENRQQIEKAQNYKWTNN